MKGAQRRQSGQPAPDLVEEAVHLLRTAPAAALAAYYLGSLPFVLGVLFFWTDMSRSPFARQHVVEAALGVSLLFLWMKFCQALFARRLRAQLAGDAPAPLRIRRALRIAFTQATLQPTGLFVLPLALVPVLPWPWAYAFYQNLTALADADATGLRELIRKAARHTRLWPRQNHTALFYLAAFGFFVFLNCTITCAALPSLLHSVLGIETVFSRGGLAMINTTFFAAMFGVTYLCVDPILKTVYVLRCFHGESIQSGADLRAELQRYAAPALRLAACLLLGVALAGAFAARAAGPAPAPAPEVSPAELDRAIGEVIQQRKYTWRMPREKIAPEESREEGMIAKFVRQVGRLIRDGLKTFFGWLENFFSWLGNMLARLFRGWSPPNAGKPAGLDWYRLSQILLYVLVAAVLSTVVILLMRLWRNRRLKPEILQTEAIQSVPDITDESVGAEQLPEDGWTKLARELLARGEFRLALRAFYLASLAHLAERNLISLARFKSNHDYERELGRRAHALPDLTQVFSDNVNSFDRVWYGTHEASGDLVSQFAANVERIKAGG
jgi:hypothetical protein